MSVLLTSPPIWDTSCQDWETRLVSGRSLVPELPLFEDEAARAVRVFNRLHLPDVPGMPTLGEATGDWFRDIVSALFGSLDVEANIRHIQEVFLLVPKKNGKSTNAAGLMVTAVIVNRRPMAEFLLIAPTKEIADISFSQAEGMIKADAELKRLFHLQKHIRKITHRVSGAFLQIKAADTDAITGVKATGILVDETHVFASKSKAANVFVEVRGALAARPDGFMIQISTQSKEPPAGVFRSELMKAREVRDGKRKLPLLAVIYELPDALAKDGGWRNPDYFGMVNPNLGKSVNVAFLSREMETAADAGPEQLALFASQHLNVEIGLGLKTNSWVGGHLWLSAIDKTLTVAEIIRRCEVACIGIDGGGLDDLLGLAVLGRERVTKKWLLWNRAWCHPSVLTLRKEIAPKLLDLQRCGDLIIVENLPDDLNDVADIVEEVNESGLLALVGLDQIGIGGIVDVLSERDVGEDRIFSISQGWKLAGAIKTTERKLADGSLHHAGQEIMSWCCGNAKVEPRGNAILITKQAAGVAKIDPLMATFNAVACMATNPEAQAGSMNGYFSSLSGSGA